MTTGAIKLGENDGLSQTMANQKWFARGSTKFIRLLRPLTNCQYNITFDNFMTHFKALKGEVAQVP